MATKTINTELLTRMFLAGAANLEAKKEFINELNVFPVPDGDTGTNMTLTIMSAAKGGQRAGTAGYDCPSSKAISSGSLRGARREFRSHPVTASQRFYKRDTRHTERSTYKFLPRHVTVPALRHIRRS